MSARLLIQHRRMAMAIVAVAALTAAGCSRGGTGEGSDPNPPQPRQSRDQPSSLTGRIVFERYDPTIDGPETYTMNPDGSDVRQLFVDGHSEMARWSPDGKLISIFCCDNGKVAHLVDPTTSDISQLAAPDADLEVHCGFSWTPDGDRLGCEVFGINDPSRTGVYSIRVADGQDLRQITSNPGGDDIPGDFSPDGTRMVFVRVDAKDQAEIGLYVTDVDGSGEHKVSGKLVADLSAGRWSPISNQILFAARRGPSYHKTIWIADADGGSPRELEIDPSCGGRLSDPEAIGCYSPAWSPEGTEIVYVRSTPEGQDEGIYIAQADGTGSVRVTEAEDDQPDWGSLPG